MTGLPQPARRTLTPLLVLELVLWLVLAGSVVVMLRSEQAAAVARQQAAGIASTSPDAVEEVEVPGQHVVSPHSGQIIGRLTIPALSLMVPIVEGDDTVSLRKGAGHVPGTAVPGGLGNMGLAAHRDTFFRPLSRVRPGMEITVTDDRGSWHYVVQKTAIVNPDRIDLLGIGDYPELTLVTCYPFHYFGPAPQRYIVSAKLVSVVSGC